MLALIVITYLDGSWGFLLGAGGAVFFFIHYMGRACFRDLEKLDLDGKDRVRDADLAGFFETYWGPHYCIVKNLFTKDDILDSDNPHRPKSRFEAIFDCLLPAFYTILIWVVTITLVYVIVQIV